MATKKAAPKAAKKAAKVVRHAPAWFGAVKKHSALIERLNALATSWAGGSFLNRRDCAAHLREALND